MQFLVKFIKNIKTCLKDSSIHGFKYIAENNGNWSESVLWVMLCALNWYACTVTVVSIRQNFIDKPTAITVDTSYLDWYTPFPTTAICSSFNQATKESAAELIRKYSNGTLDARKLSEQLFLPSRMGYLKKLENLNISGEEYAAMYDRTKPDCSKSFTVCAWNGKPFDCCNEFVTLQTAVGYCQMLNSDHAKPLRSSVEFSINRTHKYAHLAFDFTDEFIRSNPDIQIFFLNNVEIPTLATGDNKILKNIEKVVGIDFNVLDIVNEMGVRSTLADKRECRFPEENQDTLIYDLYSFDGCITDIDVAQMMEICGCVSYSYPRKPGLRVCNMTGMRCIGDYRRGILQLPSASIKRQCDPDCEGSTVSWYSYTMPGLVDDAQLGIRIRMLTTPHMRYQRYVVTSLLDVIVASGSSIGLFTGASVISIIELLYLIFCRIFKST